MGGQYCFPIAYRALSRESKILTPVHVVVSVLQLLESKLIEISHPSIKPLFGNTRFKKIVTAKSLFII